ncbi:MAG: hypothetical protein J5811_04795 [Lachnospiraceae bacterium]|nr:hypothetical protein [Lachnospiraceae bacterium]
MKIKRAISLVFIAVTFLFLISCKDIEVKENTALEEIAKENEEASVSPTPTSDVPLLDTAASDEELKEREEIQGADPSVDYDLTVMGKDMVYATVFQMVTNPKDYIGKTFKVKGMYYDSYLEETDTTYHFVVIADALACCSQGLEFIWEDDTREYPELESEVTLKGTFETYKEEGDESIYGHLVNCS